MPGHGGNRTYDLWNTSPVAIYFAIKNKYVFIKYAVVIYVAMCGQSLISDACVHAYINVQHICTLIRRAG